MHFLVEKIVEGMRQKLLKNPFFDISKAFKDIDNDKKGFIIAKDVSKNFFNVNLSLDLDIFIRVEH